MGYNNPAHIKEPTEEEKREAIILETQQYSADLEKVKNELKELVIVENNIEELKVVVEDLTLTKTSITKQLEGFNEEIQTKRDEVTNLAIDISLEQKKKNNLCERIDELKEEIQSNEATLVKVENAEKELAKVEAEKEGVSKEHTDLINKVEVLKKELESMDNAKLDLIKEQKELNEKVEKLRVETTKLNKDKLLWAEEIKNLSEVYKQKEAEAEEKLNSKLAEIQKEFKANQEKTEELLEEREGNVNFRETTLEDKLKVVRKQVVVFEKAKGKKINIIF